MSRGMEKPHFLQVLTLHFHYTITVKMEARLNCTFARTQVLFYNSERVGE